MAYYAQPRYTKDIDILVEPSEENASRILAALKAFGFGSLDIDTSDFTTPGRIVQLGYEPVRIDILTSIADLDFREVWQRRVVGSYGGQRVPFIGRAHLVRAKRAAGRATDLADLQALGEGAAGSE